ncbi:unnamed protein product [Sphenostylis stenocarpa]|uniref:Choline kinase n=1 Tax=Sphenostylis stenocarpa TaxID=92480 RepID=A0AA86VZ16_9FABA|nr:unnamed protein product [Sphenostylis stenocarpa]
MGPESQENHTTGPTENPVKDNASSSENPAGDQMGIAGKKVNNIADVGENPTKEHVAGGVEKSASDQLDGLVNIASYPAGGAENPVNGQTYTAQNPSSEQAGSVENLLTFEAGGVENPANGQAAGGAENSVDSKAGASESAMNDNAGGEESPTRNLVSGAEISLSKQTDPIENSKNETSVCCKADRLPEEAQEILKSLASHWEDVLDANALQVFPLKGAMTNEVFQIKWPTRTGETSRKVIVRIYGEGVDVFFDRDHEIQTFEFMSKNGQGPRLLGRFTNGRVEEFIHARTLSASDLRDPFISALIAAKLKEFHDLDMPGGKKFHLWDRLRNWLSEAKRLSSPKEVEAFYLDTIDKEITILERELSGPHQKIGFCHNDLQYGNIMLDEETDSVTIIDYEYASYNPVAFDIANHFCEMAANYHTEEPHILDYNKYPDFEERQRFVLAYLSTSGEQCSDDEVELLLQDIEKYTLANHLFWAVWGIISAQVNTIDFDYKEYAKQRFQEYWARKPYLLINSDAPSPYNVPEGTGELAQAAPSHKSKNSSIFRKMKRVLGLGLFRSRN